MHEQLSLFDDRAAQLTALVPTIKAAMNRAARAHPALSREQITDEMNRLAEEAGVSLTAGNGALSLSTLEKWLNPSAVGHQPTLAALVVFCRVLGNMTPLAALLGPVGCRIMTPEDKRLRDYGRACAEARTAAKRKRQMEADL